MRAVPTLGAVLLACLVLSGSFLAAVLLLVAVVLAKTAKAFLDGLRGRS